MHIERYQDIEPLAQEWDQLVDRVGETPFMRPGWFEAWRRAFGTGSLEILAFRRNGRLAGVVPLQRKGGALGSPSNWHTPEFCLLAEDDEARRALAEALFSPPRRRVTLAFVNGGRAELAACEVAAEGAGYRVLLRVLERSPYVTLDGSWSAYLERLDKHRLTETRRRRRRLEEQGCLTFEAEDGSERFEELLEEGFRVEASGWKAESGTAITSRPETRAFYTEVARWAAERGWLRLAFVRLDGHAFAFQFLIEDGGVAYQLKGGYDPGYGKFAPGVLIVYEVLGRAFASGLTGYEFLGSDEPFKLEWTQDVRERMLFQAFAPTAAGVVDWAANVHARPLARRLRALRRR